MKQFVRRIGGFFWSWGFLKVVLWVITLIVLFYAEEDWRGARAWAATKAKWEAKGETLDYRKFFAPPIPDTQNLGAIPLFRLERVEGHGGPSYLDDVPLRKAMQEGWSYDVLPTANGWIWGDPPDVGKIKASISTEYAKTFKHAPPSDDPLIQLTALYPFLPELLEAAAARPYCRFAYDDTQALPAARALDLITGQIGLAKVLTLHAILALDEHQSDLALADFKAISKLGAAAGDDPGLVGGLVEIGLSSISLEILYDGLALHAWSDPQFVEIDRVLQSMDFLATYRFAIRSEAAVCVGNYDYFKIGHRSEVGLMLDVWESPKSLNLPPSVVRDSLIDAYAFLNKHWAGGYALWPGGWFDHNKAREVECLLREIQNVDDRGRRAFPEQHDRLEQKIEQDRKSISAWAPWNALSTVTLGDGRNMADKFAYTQTRVNEARIACALERYRLAHGVYPPTLDLLVPDAISGLPHDIMNGQPYHYRLRPNGTFLLYSVGWSQTDNGGKASFVQQSYDAPGHPSPDVRHGDWAWPTPRPDQSP
jgi:hypothetical protein